MNSSIYNKGIFANYAIENISGGEVIWYGGDFFGGGPLGLRCYEDSILGYYKSRGFNLDCDTTVSNVGIEKALDPNWLSLYPNPVSGQLTVKNASPSIQSFTFKLYDLQGNLQKQSQINQASQKLDVSDLESGMYIYEIESEGQFYCDKLIIE